MGFTDAAFNPATGLLDTTTFVTTPGSETEARQQFQTLLNQLRDAINKLVDELEETETGASGAESIGAKDIEGVTGSTVAAQIENLKSQIDNVSAGSVSDGTITNTKLATDVKVGSLAALTTTAKTSVQAAINEIITKIGTLALTTTATDITAAINEINAAGWVVAAKLAAGAVTESKIGSGAVTTTKLGTVNQITFDTGDILSYDTANNELILTVAGCSPVKVVGVVADTPETPPEGTYPKNTLYIQYQP